MSLTMDPFFCPTVSWDHRYLPLPPGLSSFLDASIQVIFSHELLSYDDSICLQQMHFCGITIMVKVNMWFCDRHGNMMSSIPMIQFFVTVPAVVIQDPDWDSSPGNPRTFEMSGIVCAALIH